MDNIEHLKIETDILVKEGKTVIVDYHGQKEAYKMIGYDGTGEFQAQLQNVDDESIISILSSSNKCNTKK